MRKTAVSRRASTRQRHRDPRLCAALHLSLAPLAPSLGNICTSLAHGGEEVR